MFSFNYKMTEQYNVWWLFFTWGKINKCCRPMLLWLFSFIFLSLALIWVTSTYTITPQLHCWLWIKLLDVGPSMQIRKILLSCCWDKEFLLSVLILFMSEKNLSTFTLETGHVNNSFTGSKIDFHSSRLQDSNNLRHTTC